MYAKYMQKFASKSAKSPWGYYGFNFFKCRL